MICSAFVLNTTNTRTSIIHKFTNIVDLFVSLFPLVVVQGAIDFLLFSDIHSCFLSFLFFGSRFH